MDIENAKPKIKELAEEYGLSLVVLFGSQATGKTRRGSDVDIAYLSEKPLELMEESSLSIALMEIFKTNFVDLVSLRNASPLLQKEIADNAVVVFESKKTLFSEFVINAFKKYFDTKKLLKARSEFLDFKIKQYQKELKHV
ncbi:MAG: nucleotidyltransferase domain-containing protein [Candidatus Pacebacteria bacterium]|nr:nucleotidyltransferase domain-containing protein [Candidatus Paceibacterota bacterium]NUQ57004.1 nucleotidyltransferase domain-containing protein [Candidatus Paceibacter sp.]